MKRILAPTDLSELSRAALRYALDLGLERNAEVIVYHVVSEHGDWFGDDRLNPAAVLLPGRKELLHKFVEKHFADWIGKVKITELVETGIPYDKIVRKAQEVDADLIAMSTHGRTGIEQVMLGSVTAKVVARAGCPVLSIRPGANI